MAERIEIEISVNNRQASPALNAVSGDLAKLGTAGTGANTALGKLGSFLSGQFGGSLGKVGSLLEGEVTPALGGLSSLIGGELMTSLVALAGPLAAAFLGFQLLSKGAELAGDFLKYAIAQAIESEQVLAQLDAVLRSTGGAAGMTSEAAQALASELEAVSGVSDETIIAGENLLLTFTHIGKTVFPDATRTALDLSQAFGMNMSQASIMLGKALEDPTNGLTALRRVGVSFTEQQQEAIKSMAAHGQMARAQAMILQEVGRQVSGSAAAMGATAGGEINKLRNTWSNFGESVGNVFLPLIRGGLHNLNTTFSEMARFAEPALRDLRHAFEELERAMKDPEVQKALKDMATALGKDFAVVAATAVKDLARGITEFARLWKAHGPEIVKSMTDVVNMVDKLSAGMTQVLMLFRAYNTLHGVPGSAPGFAGGVEGFGGGMAWVGENGPEPLFLPRGSTVVSHNEAVAALSGGSGGGPTYNIYGPVNVTQEAGATLDQLFGRMSVTQFGGG